MTRPDSASGSAATKVDFKKTIPTYTAKRGTFDVVEVPSMQYLMIDGSGDPNTAEVYRESLETIYPLAYKLKFLSKRELGRDYVVPPLEAQWWSDDMDSFTAARDKSKWHWTLLLMVPDWIADEHAGEARAAVAAKGDAPRLDHCRLERLDEGLCVQTLHLGPFDDEGPVLERMHNEFIPAQQLRMSGRHHEIYFSDTRRVDPAKFRTILRQPVIPE